jgi:two-component system OmpR family response regulator
MKKVLIVEDEVKIAELVAQYLRNEGYSTVIAADGRQALRLFESEEPHLVVLDVMLPEVSGLEVCRVIRQRGDTPIIMVTARSEEVDKLLGLELGADDYITKPFSLRELAARIRAVLRRWQRESDAEKLQVGTLELDVHQRVLTVAGRALLLTPTEFRMMEMFMRSPGRVFTRSQILEGALDETFDGYERSIDTHIRNLRRKLEKENAAEYVTTVFGVGYKLDPPDRSKV